MDASVYQSLWGAMRASKPTIVTLRNKTRMGVWYESTMHIGVATDTSTKETYYIGVSDEQMESTRSAEFLSLWECPDQRTVRWMSEKLGATTQKSVYRAIYDSWIAPTKMRFADRYTDYSLITSAQADHDQFASLYTKYYDAVLQYLLARVGYNHPLAEELAQETFLRAFRYLDTFTQPHASYQTYLYRVAHSRLVSYLRKERETTALAAIPEPTVSDTHGIDRLNLQATLDHAKQLLSPAEYQVCVAFYIDQESIRDISIGTGKSCNAIKLLLSRARKKLRNSLLREI
jgi:RNA polymerase sigma-70 factor (ECF subfamily)